MKGVWVWEIFGNSVVVVSARHHNTSRKNHININCLSKTNQVSRNNIALRAAVRCIATPTVVEWENGGQVVRAAVTNRCKSISCSQGGPQSHVAFTQPLCRGSLSCLITKRKLAVVTAEKKLPCRTGMQFCCCAFSDGGLVNQLA